MPLTENSKYEFPISDYHRPMAVLPPDAKTDVLEDPRLAPLAHQGEAGTSTGINTSPGSDDDGWIVPPTVTLRDGTRVQLFKDGEALHAAYQAIKAARVRICLEVYIFADDDTGNAFADLLCDKARQGVAVYVIYDAFGSLGFSTLYREKPALFRKMLRAGVRLREFNPTRPWECRFSWRPLNRDHRKLLIIDHEFAGLGGMNIGREWGGSWIIKTKKHKGELWRDNAIGISGPAVKHLVKSFANTWTYCVRGGRVRRAAYISGIEEQAPFGLLASVPTIDSPLRPLLCDLLSRAKESIQLTIAYFAPDDDLVEELLKAAGRGVKVQLMLPSRSDVRILLIAARSFYERFLDAGIEIYERQAAILHAKTMTIDRSVTVLGSTNLDHRSIEYNFELSAIIRSPEFGRQMHELFANDIRYSRRLDRDLWRGRPWADRLVQWAVFRARYLL
jgi:cardiolipin synthase